MGLAFGDESNLALVDPTVPRDKNASRRVSGRLGQGSKRTKTGSLFRAVRRIMQRSRRKPLFPRDFCGRFESCLHCFLANRELTVWHSPRRPIGSGRSPWRVLRIRGPKKLTAPIELRRCEWSARQELAGPSSGAGQYTLRLPGIGIGHRDHPRTGDAGRRVRWRVVRTGEDEVLSSDKAGWDWRARAAVRHRRQSVHRVVSGRPRGETPPKTAVESEGIWQLRVSLSWP